MELYVVDAVMGSGKTSAAINYMNEAPFGQKFIFCTPLLSEVARIINACPQKRFKEPVVDSLNTTKLSSLKRLMRNNENIATTHSLLNNFDDEARRLVSDKGYILVLDETLEQITTQSVNPTDKSAILGLYNKVSAFGELTLNEGCTDSSIVKNSWIRRCKEHRMYMSNNIILELLPIHTFIAFEQIILLTYMFQSSVMRCYFEYFGVSSTPLYIKGNEPSNFSFTKEYVNPKMQDFSKLINICANEKMNKIGKDRNSLSLAWYEKNSDFSELRRNTHNYFQNICKSPSKNNIWTVFKAFECKVKGKGYTKGFIPCIQRGTNEYRSRTTAAYLVNRFANPFVKNFFAGRGIVLDEDGFALSEMLQWLWRSAIRDGKRINLYIPSSRMRGLLVGWLNSNKEGTD